MMTMAAFRRSLSDPAPPPDAALAVQALWWAGRADAAKADAAKAGAAKAGAAKAGWERAHHCVQQREGEPDCDWVHAYLHRLEGDDGNAAYWYRRAGQPVATMPYSEEWSAIAIALVER